MSRVDTTELPFNRKALLYTNAMIEDEDADYEEIRKMVWNIIPPFL